MRPMSLAKRSLTASCLLHLAAISGLAAWTASTDTIRPRFAGQSEAIELVMTRAESTWSPEPVTFDDAADPRTRKVPKNDRWLQSGDQLVAFA